VENEKIRERNKLQKETEAEDNEEKGKGRERERRRDLSMSFYFPQNLCFLSKKCFKNDSGRGVFCSLVFCNQLTMNKIISLCFLHSLDFR
jgi:hypothetical protein